MFFAFQMYNLSADSRLKYDYTILAPTDDAIREYLSKTNKTLLVGGGVVFPAEAQFNFNTPHL